jgi:hypothetical protein
MTPQARAELLMSYAKGPLLLKEALAGYPSEALDFKPEPGAWSLRDIVFHLAESELQGYLRMRTVIAEPGGTVMAFDQDRWTATLDASAQPLEEAVDLFRLLREMLARQVRALPEETWDWSVIHSERGAVTLEALLDGYDSHLREHLAQMARTFQAWRAS